MCAEEEVMEPWECEKKMRLCERVVMGFYYMVWYNTAIYIFFAIIEPSEPYLISSLSDDPSIGLWIVSVIAWSYLYAAYSCIATMCCGFAFTWFYSALSVLEKIQ